VALGDRARIFRSVPQATQVAKESLSIDFQIPFRQTRQRLFVRELLQGLVGSQGRLEHLPGSGELIALDLLVPLGLAALTPTMRGRRLLLHAPRQAHRLRVDLVVTLAGQPAIEVCLSRGSRSPLRPVSRRRHRSKRQRRAGPTQQRELPLAACAAFNDDGAVDRLVASTRFPASVLGLVGRGHGGLLALCGVGVDGPQ
jgi:hypothetical protein